MRVTALELFAVPPRWLFLKLSTDSGIAGWGEPIVEGRAATAAAAVQELSEHVIGSDPFRIEDLFQVMWRGGFYRGGPVLCSAISGIEQALWDVKGRALGVPAWELLGGRARARIRVYGWIGGDRPEEVADAAGAARAAGLTAVKMNATAELHYLDSEARVEEAAERVAAARAAGVDVAVDFHGRVHRAMAKRLARALEPHAPLFLEEPVLPEHPEALREVARHTSCPIACGERLYTRWGFKDVLTSGAVDIIQPDLSHAGGLLECRKIAAMAEAFDIGVAPHCPLGPVALAASLQLDACTPNAVIQEQSLGIHYNEAADLLDYVRDASVFDVVDGHMAVPAGPGLGVEVDEERVRAAAEGAPPWRNPVWRNADGTVAEW
ncbi:MAG: galactonate dehydratase [Solirubrobacteraceae bacterium]